MAGFFFEQGTLTCDGVSLQEIAHGAGTPVHVYSAALMRARFRELDAAFAAVSHTIHYAIKANSTRAVVRLLHDLGAGVDANSAGEIDCALGAGVTPADIVFTGVGKTDAELRQAIGLGVKAINAESPHELTRIEAIASAMGAQRPRVALRINPDIDAQSHPHISTGLSANKFGMSIDNAMVAARAAVGRGVIAIAGVHVHIGSQITKPEPLRRAAETAVAVARDLLGAGATIEHLDIGGGLGIAYQPDQAVVSAKEYAAAVLPVIRDCGIPVVLEPGRWIVGPAGVLVTRVLDLKHQSAGRSFVIVDAGMTDLIRPALYGAWHGIEPVTPRQGPPITCDVVGPVCETADTLGHDRLLPPTEVGDLLVVRDTGAYGAVMASNYNRRPTAAEVMVDAGAWRVIRRRQTIDDLSQWDL